MRELIRLKIIDSLAAQPPSLTRRDIHIPLVRGRAVAVIGPRRAGKTTLLWQFLADRLAAGTPREGLLYFNFEDERLAGLAAADLQLLVEEYYRLHPQWRDRQRAVFFLDEIQLVAGWETFVRRLLDTEKIEIFLSGSSARLLSREVATSMRGRAMETLVLPFSFREFLRHRGLEPTAPADRLPKAERSLLDKELQVYLTAGGFPEVQGLGQRDRFELLRSHVDTTLLRDVIERHAVSHPLALRWMVRQLLGNAGGAFSIHKFHGDLRSQGVPVAKDTLHGYLAHLEDAFLVSTVPIASESERRRMANPAQGFPDRSRDYSGLRPFGPGQFGARALETAVALELLRRGAEIAYLRTAENLEVDFLARSTDGREQLIQVCADLDSPETREREVRALSAAANDYPRAEQHLVTLAAEAVRGLPAEVRLHSAATWLLET